jgi:general secretion pathway protein I
MRRVKQGGFTLLELLVATTIMGVAVAALLGAMSASVRNQARVAGVERLALSARRQMEALLAEKDLPRFTALEGVVERDAAGKPLAGWVARVTPFEPPRGAGAGTEVLDHVRLEVWRLEGTRRTALTLDGYRRARLVPADLMDGVLRR